MKLSILFFFLVYKYWKVFFCTPVQITICIAALHSIFPQGKKGKTCMHTEKEKGEKTKKKWKKEKNTLAVSLRCPMISVLLPTGHPIFCSWFLGLKLDVYDNLIRLGFGTSLIHESPLAIFPGLSDRHPFRGIPWGGLHISDFPIGFVRENSSSVQAKN